MGHLYQRGTVWWIKYSRAGRAFYESSGSTKHAEGKRLLKLREARQRARRTDHPEGGPDAVRRSGRGLPDGIPSQSAAVVRAREAAGRPIAQAVVSGPSHGADHDG